MAGFFWYMLIGSCLMDENKYASSLGLILEESHAERYVSWNHACQSWIPFIPQIKNFGFPYFHHNICLG